ncbi:MAG: hypothetical protein RL205_1297, partial [Actinomycetota bacterium]
AQDWQRDLEDSLAELRAMGMTANLSLDLHGLLPSEVYAACITAVREACTNIRRHSGASRVSLVIATVRGGSRHRASSATIRVVDDGRGFDVEATQARFGLPKAICGPLADLGGSVQVISAPGAGVRVEMEWKAPAADSRDDVLRDLGTSARVFAAPVLIAFTVFGLISLLMTDTELTSPGYGWLGLLVYALIAAAIIWSTRVSGIPGWLVVVVCLAAPLVYRLQDQSVYPAGQGDWTDWSSECIAAMFLVVAAAGRPWWAWLAALASWLVIQGGFPFELIHPGAAVIYAGALYARSVRHNARRYERINDQRLDELANAQVAEREVALLSRRYALLEESGAQELFTSIVDGSSDLDDAGVRARADREEQYIRAVMRIGAIDDPVREVAAEILQWGRAQQIAVDIDLPVDAMPVADVTDLRSILSQAYPLARGATSARLSARTEDSALVVRLVIAGCYECEVLPQQVDSAAMVCLGEGDLMVEARYVR